MECQIEGCSADAATRGYCQPHYKKLLKSGGIETRNARLAERGRLLDHPLYYRWGRAKAAKKLCPEWLDFWAFVEGVGDSGGCSRVYQIDKTQPLGPGNFRWAEKLVGERKNAYYRDWYKNGTKGRESRYQKAYGIGVAEYEALHTAQGGVCAICKQPETKMVRAGTNEDVRQLAVDHDHETGEVRGLLCSSCNTGLGLFGDDQTRLFAAIQYLTRWGKVAKVS